MLNKQYLAVDIGNRNIKLVSGIYQKNAINISEYSIIDTPANTINDGKVVNANQLVGIIQDNLKSLKLKARHLIFQVTGTGVITRDIQIPVSTDDEIEKILLYEAPQYFPVDLESYTLDYKVLEEISNQEGRFYRLLLVAVPEKQADEYMKVANMLKMEMAALDIPANCVLKVMYGENALNKNAGQKTMNTPREYAILDIGAETTGVCIFNDGYLKFNRILLTGSSILDKLVSNEFNLDIKQAENKKIQFQKFVEEDNESDLTVEAVPFNRVIRTGIDNLVNDINRFFEFYNSRSSGNRLQKIYLCGGGSRLKGIDEYFSSFFGIPVEILQPHQHIVYKGKRSLLEFKNDYVLLVNALGALIRK